MITEHLNCKSIRSNTCCEAPMAVLVRDSLLCITISWNDKYNSPFAVFVKEVLSDLTVFFCGHLNPLSPVLVLEHEVFASESLEVPIPALGCTEREQDDNQQAQPALDVPGAASGLAVLFLETLILCFQTVETILDRL